MKKGFTILEIMVTMLLLSFLIAGIFQSCNVGKYIYDVHLGTLDMQKLIRNPLGKMAKELRQSRLSDITISNNNTQIDFKVPVNVDPVIYSRTIRYFILNNQIIREHPLGLKQTIAVNVDSLIFTLNGNLLEVAIQARINLKGQDMVFTVKELVRLRS